MLTKILSLPWGFASPLRAEVYFVNMKVFPDFKWGTRDPVAFKDSELGLVRLRAFGICNVRVLQPVLFINSLVGTQGIFTTREIADYLNRVIVSRFNDYMGECLSSILDLPRQYDELSEGLVKRLQEDFTRFGLGLQQLYINSITPPVEVQKAIDDKSRLALFDDLNRLTQMKAAMAMEKAAEAQGESGAGLGLGLGMMMPAMFAESLRKGESMPAPAVACPGCQQTVPKDAKFCPHCGHHLLIFLQCAKCGNDLRPSAKFCSQCGTPVEQKSPAAKCPHCGAENLPHATYCNQCGERL
jgi:membrane protease subunit (stomatin/prohibitin family)